MGVLLQPSVQGVVRATKRQWFTCKSCRCEADAPSGTERARLLICRKCFGRGKDKRPRELNELTGAEWARSSKSVETYPDTRTQKQRVHGACFPESLARAQINIFTRKGDTVFDPFAGVGTTLDAAVALGRKAIGIDISSKYVRVSRKDLLAKGYSEGKDFKVYTTDARQALKFVRPRSVDFVLTSPPYSALLKNVKGHFAYKWREHSLIDPVQNPRPYSAKREDLGNMPHAQYIASVSEVMAATFEILKHECYAAWVVKDFRDLKNRLPYVNLHSQIIDCAENAGLVLWDIRIFDQTKFRPLVCLGFPSRNFYLNIGHSYILVFKKLSART